MKDKIKEAIEAIKNKAVYNKSKSDKHGEVFTPFDLVNEMVDNIPKEVWSDKTKTFLDPCVGLGQFPIVLVERLFDGLKEVIPNEEDRLKHIVENQIYMGEYQRTSAEFVKSLFGFGLELNVNLYVGDSLSMPEEYFDLPYEERASKYPTNVV